MVSTCGNSFYQLIQILLYLWIQFLLVDIVSTSGYRFYQWIQFLLVDIVSTSGYSFFKWIQFLEVDIVSSVLVDIVLHYSCRYSFYKQILFLRFLWIQFCTTVVDTVSTSGYCFYSTCGYSSALLYTVQLQRQFLQVDIVSTVLVDIVSTCGYNLYLWVYCSLYFFIYVDMVPTSG